MFKKTFILLGFGIFLLCLFSFFSAFPQNPGQLNSVHLFSYYCMLTNSEFLNWYKYSSVESAMEDCLYNLRLSLMVVGYGISGIGLIVYSLRRITKICSPQE